MMVIGCDLNPGSNGDDDVYTTFNITGIPFEYNGKSGRVYVYIDTLNTRGGNATINSGNLTVVTKEIYGEHNSVCLGISEVPGTSYIDRRSTDNDYIIITAGGTYTLDYSEFSPF